MRRKVIKKYNYFYKITNNLNNHYYYGIHSTDNINDGYMGSGIRLQYAYKKYGIENFTKEILKYFGTREEAAEYEAEMVTEQLVKDNECYNCIVGGDSFNLIGMVVVYDVFEKCNKVVTQTEFKSNTDRYKGMTHGSVIVKDNGTDKFIHISVEEFKTNPFYYKTPMTGKITAVDKQGNYFAVSIDDPRYLSGELKHIWCGRKHKEEDIEKVKKTFAKIKHQQGEKNSQFGTCWVTKDGFSKSIKKEDLEKYISEGWKKGRKCNSKNKKVDKINLENVLKLRNEGYNWKEIGKELGICHATMYKFKKENNII